MLLDLQREFFDALDARGAVPLIFAGRLAEAGFAAYRNNWLAGTRKALAGDYPVVARMVGEDCFAALASAYRRAWPSRSGNLEPFGARFHTFLNAHYRSTPYAYLADVARLERAIDECLLADSADRAQVQQLATLQNTELTRVYLRTHPALRLLRSRWPLVALWQAHQSMGEPAPFDLAQGGTDVLVQRQDGQVHLRNVDGATFDLLYALMNDVPLGSALAQTFDEAALPAASTTLARLFAWGCITAVVSPSSTRPINGESP